VFIDAATVAYVSKDYYFTVSDFTGDNHAKLFRTTSPKLVRYRGGILAVTGSTIMQYSSNNQVVKFMDLSGMQVLDLIRIEDDIIAVLTNRRLVLWHRVNGVRNIGPFSDPPPVCGKLTANKTANSIVCAISGRTVCYDMNGDLNWTKEGAFFEISAPVIANSGEVVVVNRPLHSITCYSNSGNLKWSKNRDARGCFDGCIVSGNYVTGGEECVMFYNLETGAVVRRVTILTPQNLVSTELGVLAVCSSEVDLISSSGGVKRLTRLPLGYGTNAFEMVNSRYGIIKDGPVLTTIDVK